MMRRSRPESTADHHWRRERRAGLRWAMLGAITGGLLGAIAWAPASWLAGLLDRASGERLMLADARGTVWSGSAIAVLKGGAGSRDASALPGRLHWVLSPQWSGLRLTLQQACCLEAALPLDIELGWRSVSIGVPARPAGIGQWPARWLTGLGTPWNTLQLGGTLRLASPGATVQIGAGQVRLVGALHTQLEGVSSRVSAIDPLGSYRLILSGDPAKAGAATLQLTTTQGALLLTGSGQWGEAGLRFRGEARAAEGQETGLSNLLNIIGRRQGALSVISIG